MATEADPGRRLAQCAGRLVGKIRRTHRRWGMWPDEGRLAMGLSGGVDSLALVDLLQRVFATLPSAPSLVGVHVRLTADGEGGTLGEDHRRWLEDRGVELVEAAPRMSAAEPLPLTCFRCARVRRRTLLEEAERRECRFLALGHHGDDVVETWLMSQCFNGRPEALPPRRDYFQGAVTLVRPLFELRKEEIRRLAALARFPAPTPCCSREAEAGRQRIRTLIEGLGRDRRRVTRNLFWAAVRHWSQDVGQWSAGDDSLSERGPMHE